MAQDSNAYLAVGRGVRARFLELLPDCVLVVLPITDGRLRSLYFLLTGAVVSGKKVLL